MSKIAADAVGVGGLLLLLGAGACKDGGGTTDDAAADGGDTTAGDDGASDGPAADGGDGVVPVYLSPTEHLVRISMALRGTRPSAAQLAAVESDPSALEGIVDEYLDSPNFGETIRDLHNEALLVLADYFIFPAGYPDFPPLTGVDPYLLNRSVTESSLRLAEHVVMNDLPYTELVTADYTVANGVVAGVFGLGYDGDGTSWEPTQWTDGRGHAGVLSDGWLYQRHSSTVSNANRGRANAISRALLCYDFADRDVELDASINLADPDEVADAVVANPACATCHQALDPLASFFRSNFPLYVPTEPDNCVKAEGAPYEDCTYPLTTYVPEIFPEQLGVQMRAPSYFGKPGDGLDTLGAFIADDPRFWSCTSRRFYAYFHQVDLDAVPLETVAEFQDVLVGSGFDAKALTKAIVLSDEFRISHWEEEVEGDRFGLKKARPLQLAQLVRDTTGFSWVTGMSAYELGDVDLMADSFLGYQVLAGGIDSIFVTRPSHTYGATTSLVLQGLAREAAHFVVERDFATAAADRRLLREVEASDTEEGLVRDQIVALHLALYGELTDSASPAVDETYALFDAAVTQHGDVPRAWKLVIMAMLQDVKVAWY
jgi:hypothetical protein